MKVLLLALLLVLCVCSALAKNDLVAVEAELALLAAQLGAKSTSTASSLGNLAFGAETLSTEPKALSVKRAELAALVAQVEGLLGAKVVEHNDGTLALAYSTAATMADAPVTTTQDPPAKVPQATTLAGVTEDLKAELSALLQNTKSSAATLDSQNTPSAAASAAPALNRFGDDQAMILSEPVQQHPVLAAVHGELSALLPTIEMLLGAKISQRLDGTVTLNYGEYHDGPAAALSAPTTAAETPAAPPAAVPTATTLAVKTEADVPETPHEPAAKVPQATTQAAGVEELKAELSALLQNDKSSESSAATQSDNEAETLAATAETPSNNNAPDGSTDATKRTLTVVGIVVASVAFPLFLAVVAALVVAAIVIHRKRNRVPDVNELMLLENAHQD